MCQLLVTSPRLSRAVLGKCQPITLNGLTSTDYWQHPQLMLVHILQPWRQTECVKMDGFLLEVLCPTSVPAQQQERRMCGRNENIPTPEN
jgi:hypothetical protein